MYLAKDRDRWCPAVNTILTLRVAYETEDVIYLPIYTYLEFKNETLPLIFENELPFGH